jgi:hypothetical protein
MLFKKFVAVSALVFAAFGASAQGNLVVNGDFQTGTFAGWTKSGNTSLSDVISNTVTSNHSFVWRAGSTGSLGYISQNIATQIGQTYSFSYDVYNTATRNSIFEAYFDGVKIAGFTNEVHNWTHYSFDNLVATGLATEIKFGARNDPSFTRLDNVTLTAAVPEPETYALMLAGLGLIGAVSRRRNKRQD